MTLLRGKAAKVNLTLEEGTIFDPVFHNLADGAADENGEHEAFEEYSVAYFTAMTAQNGDTLFQLGPEEDALDGTCILDADGGTIECSLPPVKSIGLVLPGRSGWYNLVIYPGGDDTRAVRYAEGELIYSRRAIERPEEES